jgi:hypothetical protein
LPWLSLDWDRGYLRHQAENFNSLLKGVVHCNTAVCDQEPDGLAGRNRALKKRSYIVGAFSRNAIALHRSAELRTIPLVFTQ